MLVTVPVDVTSCLLTNCTPPPDDPGIEYLAFGIVPVVNSAAFKLLAVRGGTVTLSN